MKFKLWRNLVSYDEYEFHKIQPDDTINIVLKKLCVYLKDSTQNSGPNDFYLWTTRKITKNPQLVSHMLNNLYQNNQRIPYADFQKAVRNYFDVEIIETSYTIIDKNTAYHLIMKEDIKTIVEPLIFKYVFNDYFQYIQYDPLKNVYDENVELYSTNSYFDMTLQYFGSMDCIHIILYKDFKHMPWYFPFRTRAVDIKEIVDFVYNLDLIEEQLSRVDTSNCTHTENISYLQLKCNDINLNRKTDLGKAFDKLSTSIDVPFIKFKTFTNVYYKVDKDFVKNPDHMSHFEKWTEFTGQTRKYQENAFLIFEVKYMPGIYCSFKVWDNFEYDIKFSIGKTRRTTYEQIIAFCESRLRDILNDLRKLYPEAHLPDIADNNVSIVHVNSFDTIALEKKSISYNQFEKVIKQLMFVYFNVIPNKERNVLLLQYKKVDNYMKYDNITAFIMNNPRLSRNDMIGELSKWFRMTAEDATREYERVESELVMKLDTEHGKKIFRPRTDGFVNIRIRMLSPVDMDFEVSGFKYFATHDRIIELLKVLINLTHEKIEEVNVKKIEKGLITREEGLVTLKDIEKEEIGEIESEIDFESLGEAPAEGELDLDYAALLEEVEDVAEGAEDAEGAEGTEGATSTKSRDGYLLRKLKAADQELFIYKAKTEGPKKQRTDFSTTCSGRYPIPITKEQKTHIDKAHPRAYNRALRIGSTAELADKNYYICPDVWCPKSMIAMNMEQFEKAGKKCPGENERPMTFKSTNRFIGVLDPFIHPKNYCIPCCFKSDTLKEKGKGKKKLETCKQRAPELLYLDEEETLEIVGEEEELVGNPKYIKGEFNWPLHAGHYGCLPKDLYKVLGERKCGDRPDGTGNMTLDCECFLRRGSSNKEQSFFACMVEILKNPEIENIADIAKIVRNNLKLDRFLSLENGKILKAFVNEKFNIFDETNFAEFVDWYLEQKSYIVKFNQGKVYRCLLALEQKVFSRALRHFKDIIREFMIYNGYKHFIGYIESAEFKDHRALLDLFNSEKEYLNPKNINVIMLHIAGDQVLAQCPIHDPDVRYPFAFILFNGKYYETLCKVTFTRESGIYPRNTFNHATALPEMRALIDFVVSNCRSETLGARAISDIELATGLKTKYLVLDYGFKIKGVLLKDNIYVPLKQKLVIYNLVRKKFIYYSDLLNYKCLVDAEAVYKRLPDYKILEKTEKYLRLENNIIIPLNIKKNEVFYNVFEDDLDIFVQHEKEDPRKNIVMIINENKKIFSVFLNSVLTYMNAHPDVKEEIEFITDFKNPFPMNFKRKKLAELMSRIVKDVLILPDSPEAAKLVEEFGGPCPEPTWDRCLIGIPEDKINDFKIKISEQLLINNSFYFDSRTKIYRHAPSEFLFEHHDIVAGKHLDSIKRLQDPFRVILEMLDQEFGEYVFADIKNEGGYLNAFIGPDVTFKSNYEKFNLIVRNTLVVDNEQNYTNMYIYQWFEQVAREIRSAASYDAVAFKNLVRNHIINDYEYPQIAQLTKSRCFDKLWTDYKKIHKLAVPGQKPPIDVLLDLFGSVDYYPALYEIRVLAEIIGVDVIIFTRSSVRKDNETGIEFLNNRASNYILLHNRYDKNTFKDIYAPVGIYPEKIKETIDRNLIAYTFDRLNIRRLVDLARLKAVVGEENIPEEFSD